MVVLTVDERVQLREALNQNADALKALDMIDDCEGDLEDAAIAVALHVGQEPDRSDDWLTGLAKRWRVSICRGSCHEALAQANVAAAIPALVTDTGLPPTLATLVIIYVAKTGVESFCKPLGELL